jgi:hypothetical protein
MIIRLPDLFTSAESRVIWLRDAAWGIGIAAGWIEGAISYAK